MWRVVVVVVVLAGCGSESLVPSVEAAPEAGATSRPDAAPVGRALHAMAKRGDGSWLIVGGYTKVPGARRVLSHSVVLSADLRRPRRGPAMTDARWGHTATALPGGVLVLGGSMETPERSPFEVGRPEQLSAGASAWRGAGGMVLGLALHTATPLGDGRVLVIGGADGYEKAQRAGWLFDPSKPSWSRIPPMRYARFEHTATLLGDGRVLVVGGHIGVGCGLGCPIDCIEDSDCAAPNAACADGYYCAAPIAMAEIFDPKAGTWAHAGPLQAARVGHTATVLPDGRVLVAGGRLGHTVLDSVEVFDPRTGQWTQAASLKQPRFSHTATALPTGGVLVAGGRTHERLVMACEDGVPCLEEWIQSPLAATEAFDPDTGEWRLGAALVRGRWGHTAAPAGDKLLVWGGAGLDGMSVAGGEVFSEGQWHRIEAPKR